MATTAEISSAFDISVTLDSAATHTIAIGRAFRVVQISVFNGTGTPNITVTNGSADIAATQALVANSWKLLALQEANCNLTAAQSLVITNANVSTTKLIFTCVATGGGQSLVAS